MTFPLLTGPQSLTSGFVVVRAWRGAKLTIIAPAGTLVDYSYPDTMDAAAHDSDSTVQTTDVVTTIDVVWPFIALDRASGSGTVRYALT